MKDSKEQPQFAEPAADDLSLQQVMKRSGGAFDQFLETL